MGVAHYGMILSFLKVNELYFQENTGSREDWQFTIGQFRERSRLCID